MKAEGLWPRRALGSQCRSTISFKFSPYILFFKEIYLHDTVCALTIAYEHSAFDSELGWGSAKFIKRPASFILLILSSVRCLFHCFFKKWKLFQFWIRVAPLSSMARSNSLCTTMSNSSQRTLPFRTLSSHADFDLSFDPSLLALLALPFSP